MENHLKELFVKARDMLTMNIYSSALQHWQAEKIINATGAAEDLNGDQKLVLIYCQFNCYYFKLDN